MSESKELTVLERAALALASPQHEQELRELVAASASIVAIKNKDGREQCHTALMTLKGRRTSIEKAGKAAREDATAFSKAVIAEEKRLVAIAEPEEIRLQDLRDDWDESEEAKKRTKREAEANRVAAIRERIDFIRAFATNSVGMPANKMAAMLETLEAEPVTLEHFQEFAGEAEMVKATTVLKLSAMLEAQRDHEAEQARLAAEREALERQRAELAEQERKAAAARAEQEAKDRAERERVEAEQRAAQEKAAAELRAQQEAHAKLVREQQAEIARQQAAIDAARAEQERIERERLAAIEAEERRKREEAEAAARAEAARIRAEQDAAIAEQQRREREQFAINGPGDVEIVETLANHYAVEIGDVMEWMKKFDYAAADEHFAAANVAAN